MIDTLRLLVEPPKVRPHNQFTPLPPGTRNEWMDIALWETPDGQVQTGSGARYHDEFLHVELVPLKGPTRLGAFIQFSVAKWQHGYANIGVVDAEALTTILTNVESHLGEVGLDIDIWSAAVSRLDLFKDIQTQHGFQEYAELLAAKDLSYMPAERYKDSTVYWGLENASRTLTTYDKHAEQSTKNYPNDVPENVQRFEYRLKNAKKVQDEIGVQTAGELVEEFEALESIFIQKVDELFPDFLDDLSKLQGTDSTPIRTYYEKHKGRQWRHHFRKHQEYIRQLKNGATIDEIVQGKAEALNRSQGWKSVERKRIRAIRLLESLLTVQGDGCVDNECTIGVSLYRELQAALTESGKAARREPETLEVESESSEAARPERPSVTAVALANARTAILGRPNGPLEWDRSPADGREKVSGLSVPRAQSRADPPPTVLVKPGAVLPEFPPGDMDGIAPEYRVGLHGAFSSRVRERAPP